MSLIALILVIAAIIVAILALVGVSARVNLPALGVLLLGIALLLPRL